MSKDYEQNFFDLPDDVQESVQFFSEYSKELKAAKLLLKEADKKKKVILEHSAVQRDDEPMHVFLDSEDDLTVQIDFRKNPQGITQKYNMALIKKTWKDPYERHTLKPYFKLEFVPVKKFSKSDMDELNQLFEKKIVVQKQTGKPFKQVFSIL